MSLVHFLFPSACPRWSLEFAVLAGAMLLSACSTESSPPPSNMLAAAVTVAVVETADAVQYGEYAARVRSAGAVELRAQVGGVLKERLYQEGQLVLQGEGLFQIDPEPYELALLRASAERVEAEAEHNNTKREWRRQQDLFDRKVSSEQDRDKAETSLKAASARLQKAEAAENDTKRLLRYAQLEAPVAGIAGLEALAPGNLVEVGTLLTTITPLDPIHVRITLSARDASLYRAALAYQAGEPVETPLLLDTGRGSTHAGQLNFADACIDPRTDSIQMRAVFPNPDGELLPGQFVRVKLPLRTFKDVVLIEPKAVTEGPGGPQVFKVEYGDAAGDQTVRAQPVELGPVVKGLQVVFAGLAAGDLLVVNGQVSLRHGSAVNVIETVSPPGHALTKQTPTQQARTRTQAGR